MTVAEYIEWLKTMPQSAKVSVLSHSEGHGYYMQGGSCTTEEFNPSENWRHSEDWYIDGEHFELNSRAGQEYTLQIGVMGK